MRIACLLKWFYGVTVAQEILVLLEIVRFSLELLNTFFIINYLSYFVRQLVKVVVLYWESTLFKCFVLLKYFVFFSTDCDKSLSFALKAIR